MSRPTPALLLLLTWLGATLITLLNFSVGIGADFIQDDYAWLECAHEAASDPSHLFTLHISGFWRPLVHLFFLGCSWIFGPSPLGFHLATAILHGLVAALLGRLVVALTDDLPHGVLTSLLFVLLPAHAEVPLWISAVTESIHAAAALMAMIGFVLLLRTPPRHSIWRPLLLCLLGFVMALTAKETAVILLPLLLLLRILIATNAKTAPGRAARWPLVPLLILTLLYIGLQLRLQRSSPLIGAGTYSLGLHQLTWIGNACWELLSSGWPALAALILSSLLTRRGCGLWPARQRAWVTYGAIAGVMLLPMLPYAPLGTTLASRYLYLPTAVAAALLALLLRRLAAGGRTAQLLGLVALLGMVAQGALLNSRAAQRHRSTADETSAFIRAAARHRAPRLPVRIFAAPLRGQHLAAAMHLFHPTKARRFRYVKPGRVITGQRGSVWRWHRRGRRLEVIVP